MRTIAVVSLLALATPCFAQTADSRVAFDVVSVKPAAPDDGRGMTHVQGGLGTADPGQVSYTNITLMNLLLRAYPGSYRVTGPGWLDDQRYDVVAKIPPETTKDQFKLMLQNLLAERFGVKVHHETKEFPSYDLVVAKGGPKLKKAVEYANGPSGGQPGPLKFDQSGFPQLDRPGLVTLNTSGPNGVPVARLTARAQPISKLVPDLSNVLKEPVQDKTGLTGVYDFTLEYAPRGTMAAAPAAEAEVSAPGIAEAIKTLGLTLERSRTVLEVLVVDHAERVPTVN
jgi:uncharacterized protein (TIGR03435 family)